MNPHIWDPLGSSGMVRDPLRCQGTEALGFSTVLQSSIRVEDKRLTQT